MYIIHIYTHIPIFTYIYKYTRYHIYIYMICIHIFNTYTHKYTMYHIYIYIHKHIRYQTMDTNHTCTLEFLTIIIIAPQSVTSEFMELKKNELPCIIYTCTSKSIIQSYPPIYHSSD